MWRAKILGGRPTNNVQINIGLDWTTNIEAEERVRYKWIEEIE